MTSARAFASVVADARLAPSAHNTQPVRWRLDGDAISLFADTTRRLPASDPDDRDLKIGCGAAVEGTVLALAAQGLGAGVTWTDKDVGHPYRHVARVLPRGMPTAEDVTLSACVHRRTTHRGGFLPAGTDTVLTLCNAHITLVTQPEEIAWLASSLDLASASLLREKAVRQELLDWMRLTPKDAGYRTDGLNAETLFLNGLAARAVPLVLGTQLYDVLAGLGLGPALSSEHPKTMSSSAIALFHWPEDGSVYDAGRAFYRAWLEATGLGLAGWPAAALADEPGARSEVSTRYGIPETHRLLNTLRLGRPDGATPARARLPVSELII